MKGNPLFIIDDEADAASLNTLVNKGKQSSINKYLDAIKNGASSSIYLQVTGTPQAILLQSMESGWHPLFTYYFEPGSSYIGGDFFFPKGDVPPSIHILDDITDPTHKVVIRHLISSGITLAIGGTVSNCLFHPSVRQAVHSKYAKVIATQLEWCKINFKTAFFTEAKAEYDAIYALNSSQPAFDDVISIVDKILIDGSIKTIIMNGKSSISSVEYSKGVNYIVGGNTLGRGVTFPSLNTIYYTRTSKKPQADTMWQHSRMFGYDRSKALMAVYIDNHLYKLFADINSTNNSIISQVENGINNIKLHFSEGLNPTRKNVLDNKKVAIISGGTNYYPYNPKNNSIDDITSLLSTFDDTSDYYQVSLRLMCEILNHIQSDDDFSVRTYHQIISSILSEKPSTQGILIVRRERNVAKGTGALLSPNDWRLGASFTDKVVLTMYQMTGEKGWGGQKIWVPNIKLPMNNVYYDVDDSDDEE